MNIEQKIKDAIRDVADFPQEGVVFKDVTPLLADPVLSNEIVDEMIRKTAHLKIDAVVAIESRGFLYGFLLANIKRGWNILVHDDLLATGGTAHAAAELITMQNAHVAAFAFVIELSFFHGINKLKPYSDNIVSLATY